MVPPHHLALGGVGFFLFLLGLGSRRKLVRYAAKSAVFGCTSGLGLSYLNNYHGHMFYSKNKPLPLKSLTLNFKQIYPRIYDGLSERYEELGELELGEEHLTVEPDIFAQIGVIDIEGIRKMWYSVIIPQLRLLNGFDSLSIGNQRSPVEVEKDVVFCDIGSGVGNVCLQILTETSCKKTVGIEVIPSRHRNASIAFEKANEYYPDNFRGKTAVFIQDNFVNCTQRLEQEKVSVVFTHSWMFDDELMNKLSETVSNVPSVRCIVTSRELNERKFQNGVFRLVSKVHLSSDWNDEAPFYVYTKIN